MAITSSACVLTDKEAILEMWAQWTPRGGTLKFSVYIGEADFFGVKILNFRIFLGFQKN